MRTMARVAAFAALALFACCAQSSQAWAHPILAPAPAPAAAGDSNSAHILHQRDVSPAVFEAAACGNAPVLVIENYQFPNNDALPSGFPGVQPSDTLTANQLQSVTISGFTSFSRATNTMVASFNNNSGFYLMNTNGVKISDYSMLVIRVSGSAGGEEQHLNLNLNGVSPTPFRALTAWTTGTITTSPSSLRIPLTGLTGNLQQIIIQTNTNVATTVNFREIFLCGFAASPSPVPTPSAAASVAAAPSPSTTPTAAAVPSSTPSPTPSPSPSNQPSIVMLPSPSTATTGNAGQMTAGGGGGGGAMNPMPIVIGAAVGGALVVFGIGIAAYLRLNTRERITARNARYIVKNIWATGGRNSVKLTVPDS